MQATYLPLRVPRRVELRREELMKKNRERAEALVREKRKREEAKVQAERDLQARPDREEQERLAVIRSIAGSLEEQLNPLRRTSKPPTREAFEWRGPGGQTAVYQWAERCNQDRVLHLLAWGADPSVGTKFGEIALDAARRGKCKPVGNTLEAAEAMAWVPSIMAIRSAD